MIRAILVWLGLLGLLALAAAAHLVLPGRAGAWVALAIGGVQAGLIVLVYMELASASRTVRLVALTGLLWPLILVGLAADDFLLRPQERTAPLEERAPEP